MSGKDECVVEWVDGLTLSIVFDFDECVRVCACASARACVICGVCSYLHAGRHGVELR